MRKLLLTMAFAALAVVACDAENSTTPPSGPDRPAANTTNGTVSDAELAEDIAAAEQVLDRYWTTHWQDFFTGSYQPPVVRGVYDETTAPTCGGEPLEVDNAAY
jgi:uncharacterized protein